MKFPHPIGVDQKGASLGAATRVDRDGAGERLVSPGASRECDFRDHESESGVITKILYNIQVI